MNWGVVSSHDRYWGVDLLILVDRKGEDEAGEDEAGFSGRHGGEPLVIVYNFYEVVYHNGRLRMLHSRPTFQPIAASRIRLKMEFQEILCLTTETLVRQLPSLPSAECSRYT